MATMLRWITTIITQNSKNSRQKNGRVASVPKAKSTNPDDVQATMFQEVAGMTKDEKIQEAFLIDLETTELDRYGSKIEAVLAKK